jgi:hypothetical protein
MIELNLEMLIDGHETRRAPSNIFLGMYHSQPTPINQQKKKRKTAQHIFFPLILPFI